MLRRGFALEYATLAWNVAGIVVLAIAAISARSVALAGFALDSLIEIGASTVVIWELSGTGEERQRRGLRLIGYAFAALAAYLLVQALRRTALAGTELAEARDGTIRLKLLKVAARVAVSARRVVFHLASSYPDRGPFERVAERLLGG